MKSIEIFAGAYGLGIGVTKAGFKPIQVVEKDKWCCQTIAENSKNLSLNLQHLVQSDIRNVDFTRFEDQVDLISGGPPCQPFSLGGKHQAQLDHRDLFPEAVRVISEVRPKSFVIENVKGLTRESFVNYFEYIKLQLTYPHFKRSPNESWLEHLSKLEAKYTKGNHCDLHYNVVARVLNAANYGVPQKRERVFLVGIRSDLELEWQFPEPTHSLESLAWDMKFGSYWEQLSVPKRERLLPRNYEKLLSNLSARPLAKPWITVRNALYDLPDPQRLPKKSASYLDHEFQPGAKSYPGHTGSGLDEPAKTLKAGVHGVPGGENMVRLFDGSVRYFTIRECARLQGFPDNYKFHGSWTATLKQLGNAVPVNLAKAVAGSVASLLS